MVLTIDETFKPRSLAAQLRPFVMREDYADLLLEVSRENNRYHVRELQRLETPAQRALYGGEVIADALQRNLLTQDALTATVTRVENGELLAVIPSLRNQVLARNPGIDLGKFGVSASPPGKDDGWEWPI